MRKENFEDDGRTICSMDADGMPASVFDRAGSNGKTRGISAEERITRTEARRYSLYAILAGLTVAGVVGGGTILFILLLWLLWG